MVDEDEAPQRAPRRAWLEIGVTVMVLAAVAVALAIGLSTDDERGESPLLPAIETTTTVLGDRQFDRFGVMIHVPEGAIDPSTDLRADLRSIPTSHLRAFVPVSPFLALDLGGADLNGPIRLEFPIDDASLGPDPADPVLMVLAVDGEEIDVIEGTWDPATRRHRVVLDRIADVGVVTWDWDRIDALVDEQVGDLTREPAPAPDCDATLGEEAIGGSGGMTWCLRLDGAENRILRGRNRTRQFVRVAWNGASLVGHADTSDLGELLGEVARWRTTTSLLLGPAGTVELTVPGDSNASVTSRWDRDSERATWMIAGVDLITELGRILPDADEPGSADVVRGLDPYCAVEADRIEEIVRACFDPVRVEVIVGGASAPYLTRLLQPNLIGASWTRAFEAADAILTGHGRTDVSVERLPPSGGSWPFRSWDIDPLLDEALDRDGFDPWWVRCLGDLCLGGSTEFIRVYHFDLDVDRWRADLEFPADDADPAGQLFALGFDEQRIFALLDP